ncbi:MAG TPA: hypothetical protein VJ385_13680 [Fibrobacteria bacterium]|nr:hypothetical protein [Fibrobacteria bacterium]
MAQDGKGAGKDELLESLLKGLREDSIGVLDEFTEHQKSGAQFFEKVEVAHEFLDLLTFKIKESKSRMNKEQLAQFSLAFLRQTIRTYGYNPKFVATQTKALITYYQNQKNLDKAIEVCEFLILQGITDDDAKGFHVRLDELFRLKRKIEEKGGDVSGISFPAVDDDEDDGRDG